uniref:AlNc14C330G10688 protein n=1 Tax=Albugo laibachii Nc14 TaxID=890382 RepID=F0WWS5_9STRA|nr:AlNc14C330G10688 [Albugo laibachii Nc14]|eukprot:CCA25902.1 AlNc14C330G10688 [Albugo laibachii Nc14]
MDATAIKFVTQWSKALFQQWKKDRSTTTISPDDLFWNDTAFLHSILAEAIAKLPALPLQTFLTTNITQYASVAAESLSTEFEKSAFTLLEAPKNENNAFRLESSSPSKLIDQIEGLWTEKQLCRFRSDLKAIQDDIRCINDICSCTNALLAQWEQVSNSDCERIRNVYLKIWTALLLFPSIESTDPFDNSPKHDSITSSVAITRAAVCLIAINSATQNDAYLNKAIQLVLYYHTSSHTKSNLTENWLMDVLLELHRNQISCTHDSLSQMYDAAFSQKAPENKQEMVFLNTLCCYRYCTGTLNHAPKVSIFGDSLGKKLLPNEFCRWANFSNDPTCRMLGKLAHQPAASIFSDTIIPTSMLDTFIQVSDGHFVNRKFTFTL